MEKTIADNEAAKPLSRFYIYRNGEVKPIIIDGDRLDESWTIGPYSLAPTSIRDCYVLINNKRIALVTNINGWKKEEIK